ncbi:MAG: hypothetical protein FWE14_04325 [Lachnospiraceae bacterium]|nr:hypothetical protein [Lachnospiraceae bacterium]
MRNTVDFFLLLRSLKSKLNVSNGHGGNKLLKVVVAELGMDYITQNFQYSILENYNARVNKDIILERESWWKETLGSRAFGLNAN